MGRGRAHERPGHGQRRKGGAGGRRRSHSLLPDGALLRHHARGAAGLAVAPDPARFELRDLQDRGRAVHRDVRPRLRVAAPGQRLRAAQHLRPAADLLPPPHGGQGRVRDGHAPRLHLRRRPDRRGLAGCGGRDGPRHLPRLLGLGLLDQGALRRDDRGAARGGAGRGGGGAPQGRGRRLHDPARPVTHPRGLRLGAEDAARGGRAQRDRLLQGERRHPDVHAPEGRGDGDLDARTVDASDVPGTDTLRDEGGNASW